MVDLTPGQQAEIQAKVDAIVDFVVGQGVDLTNQIAVQMMWFNNAPTSLRPDRHAPDFIPLQMAVLAKAKAKAKAKAA